MRIIWAPRALQRVAEAVEYIAHERPSARTVGGRRFVFVEFTARQELTTGPDASCAEKRALPVDASGLDDHHRVVASLGGKLAHFPATQLEPIEVEVDSGPLDIIASRFLGFGTDQVDRMLLLRNHDAGAALTLDFSGEESFQPVPIDVTIQNLGSALGRTMAFYDMDQPGTAYFQESGASTNALRRLPGVPRDLRLSFRGFDWSLSQNTGIGGPLYGSTREAKHPRFR